MHEGHESKECTREGEGDKYADARLGKWSDEGKKLHGFGSITRKYETGKRGLLM